MFRVLLLISLLLAPAVYASNNTVRRIGDLGQVALPVTALAMTWAFDDLGFEEDNGFMQLAKTFALTEITTHSLKYTVESKRPNGEKHSFPSGHTAAAFAGSGFIQKRYGWEYGIPAHLLAAFVGYSRIETKAHWASDVIAGAAIGLFYNYIFTTPFNASSHVYPIVTSNSVAIAWQGNF